MSVASTAYFSPSLDGVFSELVKISFLQGEHNFDVSSEICIDIGGSLGRVDNGLISNFLRELRVRDDSLTGDFWIGLRRDEEDSGTDPTNFDFVDELGGDKSFFDSRGNSPWASGQPDGGDDGDEECVEIQMNGNLPWNDDQCGNQQRAICTGASNSDEIATASSDCFENGFGNSGEDRFILINEIMNFNALTTICKDIFNGTPARIQNEDELIIARNLNNENGGGSFYIGVVREALFGVEDGLDFKFFDDLPGGDSSFLGRVGGGEFPWSGNEPNNAGSQENCVEATGSSALWNDLPCSRPRKGLCRVECVPPETPLPTLSPETPRPSFSPETSAPSVSPETLTPSAPPEVSTANEVNAFSLAVSYSSLALIIVLLVVYIRYRSMVKAMQKELEDLRNSPEVQLVEDLL